MRRDLSRVSITLAAVLLTAAGVIATSASQQQKVRQPATAGGSQAKIDLDDLEDHPEKFLGKTVTVEGEVDRVLGPHLFTIDEKDWADPERELPVVVPEPFAAIVRSDTPVRVTGTVEKVPMAKIERDWGFLSNEAKVKAEIETRPVLLATEVSTTAPAAVSLRVRTDQQPVGTSGTSATSPMTDAGQLAKSTDTSLVGRQVDLKNATVSGVGPDGFWIRLPTGERIFVMSSKKTDVREGQTAEIRGIVLEMPDGVQIKVDAGDEPIYIYADRITTR